MPYSSFVHRSFLVYLYRQIKASQIKGNARLVEFGLVIIGPQMQ